MPRFADLTEEQVSATVALLRKIIADEQAIASGQPPQSDRDNTERINALIASEQLVGWDRKALGGVMNRMRRVLADEASAVGVYPNGKLKTGPARGVSGVRDRLKSLGLL